MRPEGFLKRREVSMADCSTMKKGEIYTCRECGFEIQVLHECDEAICSSRECSGRGECTFSCCGEDLVKKE
jgi:predicted nucleic acid-binding Zn ribbon protein